MKFVVSYHAAKAGCIASMVSEASAPELLLNELPHCSVVACSTPSHPWSSPTRSTLSARICRRRPLSPRTSARANSMSFDLPCTVSSAPSKEATTFGQRSERPDGTILHPLTQRTVWFDVAGVHTACKSHLKNELKFTRDRCASGKAGVRDVQQAA